MKDSIPIGASVDIHLDAWPDKLSGEVTKVDDGVVGLSHVAGFIPGVRVIVPIDRILFVVFKD